MTFAPERKAVNKYAQTPCTPEHYMRMQQERLQARADHLILDAIGNPLRTPDASVGTFSNQPATLAPDLTQLLEARRRLVDAIPGPPERFDFEGVSVCGFWLVIRSVVFTAFNAIDGELVITSMVPDRSTGKPIGITFTKGVGVALWNASSPARAGIIRATIREWLNHELDEHLFVDGERVFDPHTRPASRSPELKFPFESGIR